jgi:CheY-like chemotaxis protein
VKRIVEMHGGSVEAHSAGSGLGSEFVVRLPALDVVLEREAPAAPEGMPAAAEQRRILVVDDNEDAATLLAMTLSIYGHDTRIAHDGPQALAVAAEYRPDIVFLDIGLPTVDGYDTARAIREQPWGKDVRLVALTGWGHAADRRRSREAGFDHHLVKPADAETIVELIASLEPANAKPAIES